MRSSRRRLVLFPCRQVLQLAALLPVLFGWLGVAPAAAQPATTLDDLAWLAGHWRSERGGEVTEELWTKPAGGVLLGLNRQVRPGRRAAFEYLRIEDGPGGIRYLASPGGQPPTPFPFARSGERWVVFENPEHDWPQVIEYRLDDQGAMHVRASGLGEGSHTLAWTMERVRE